MYDYDELYPYESPQWDIPLYIEEPYPVVEHEVIICIPSQIVEAWSHAPLQEEPPRRQRETGPLEGRKAKTTSKNMPVVLLVIVILASVVGLTLLMAPSTAKHASSAVKTIPASSGDYTVTAPNELSPDQINAILKYYGSQYPGEGQDIYDLGQQYGIDDIYFLADYRKESSFGNSVLASYPYYNPTGMECSDLSEGCTGVDGNGRNWGTWTSPRNGYEAWFKQISQRYVSGAIDGGYRLTTIWLIACGPNGTGMYDGGSGCNQYAADIEGWVDTWRSGKM